MPIQVARDGPVAIIELDGLIETRASQQFEKEASMLLGDNVAAVVVDFAKTALITSAGIRVLFMMGQRLQRSGADVTFLEFEGDEHLPAGVTALLRGIPFALRPRPSSR